MFYSLEYNVKDTTYTLFFTIFLGPPLSRKFTAFHGQTLVYRVAFTQVHGGFTGDFFDFFLHNVHGSFTGGVHVIQKDANVPFPTNFTRSVYCFQLLNCRLRPGLSPTSFKMPLKSLSQK